MLEELDVVKAAHIADRVMEHSTYAMVGGIFFFFLFLLIIAILVLVILRLGVKGKRVGCNCGANTPQKFA